MDKDLETRLDKLELVVREMRDFVACIHQELVHHEDPVTTNGDAPVVSINKPRKPTAKKPAKT